MFTSPAVVIDNGSYTTKAGFALEDLPSLVFSSNYQKHNDTVLVGENMQPEHEVMTLIDNGLIYDFENIIHNWEHVYKHIDNLSPIDAKEYPLVLTEQSWNTSKNKLATAQLVFENLQVPIFSLVKNPLAQLYRVGKLTGLVIDIGSSVASVTPILDGIIQTKSSFHLKYAGDFLNLHVLNYVQSKTTLESLLPSQFQNATDSFKHHYTSHHFLQEYKNLTLNFQLSDYQLYNHQHISLADQPSYLENLFQPNLNKLPNVTIPEPVVDKPHTHGLTNLIFLCLKSLEGTLLPNDGSAGSGSHNKFARFNEIFKGLLSNVLITGGTSLANGLIDQVLNDLRILTPKYFPNYSYSPYSITQISNLSPASDINEVWDKQFSGWLGACSLASMLNDGNQDSLNIALDNWFVTKSDYEELGEDLILEKFK
ncbi:actin-domain-containing protein [Suhomyces tanzawaensis NRRL Y-17324]|uniref:Actin-domain-containing protein n=1 Tax=Suhomyces tanzawaensis NRRL Y-17324 TaxID=984487 RepID=A0A1E4SLH4_9ASCO|nr:actin-domain-containing protein [Suhomyces tanzawaensis NRRL Y-17324]ODV80348.1 actin-domain-containing protein [Suhomyces tanzawaensis NRRL Y-17324]